MQWECKLENEKIYAHKKKNQQQQHKQKPYLSFDIKKDVERDFM